MVEFKDRSIDDYKHHVENIAKALDDIKHQPEDLMNVFILCIILLIDNKVENEYKREAAEMVGQTILKNYPIKVTN